MTEAETEFVAWDCFATREIGRTPEGRPIKVWAVTAPGGGAKQTVVLHNGQYGPFAIPSCTGSAPIRHAPEMEYEMQNCLLIILEDEAGRRAWLSPIWMNMVIPAEGATR